MAILSFRGDSSRLLCSVRFLITILACFCLVVNYLQRVNLTQTIVSMTDSTVCPENLANKSSASNKVDWNRKTQGFVLSAYFYGYLITQAIGGILAYKFGPQKVLLISVTGSSLFTLSTPFAAQMNATCMFVVRFLLGFLASVNWPALLQLLSEWAPKQERSRLIAISNSGAQLGTIIALPLSGVLCDQSFMGGWPLVFYVSGSVGIVWTCIWAMVARSRPENHHFISRSERDYIIANRAMGNSGGGRNSIKVPYRAIFRSIPCWGMFASHFFKAVGFYTILTNISRYNKDVLQMNVKKSGFLSSIPYISYWIMTIVCGIACDKLINSGRFTRTAVRKVFTGLGNFLPAIFILILGFVPANSTVLGTVLFTLVLASTGFNTGGGMYCSANDMAPRFAGIIWGISNTFGNLPGIICPTMVGWIVRDGSIEQWRIVFSVCAASYALSGISFILTGTGEVQDWAKDKPEENNAEEGSQESAEEPEKQAV